MKPATFVEIGKLYEDENGYWQTPLARALLVHRVTVWRYATGKTKIPDYVATAIKVLKKEKEKEDVGNKSSNEHSDQGERTNR